MVRQHKAAIRSNSGFLIFLLQSLVMRLFLDHRSVLRTVKSVGLIESLWRAYEVTSERPSGCASMPPLASRYPLAVPQKVAVSEYHPTTSSYGFLTDFCETLTWSQEQRCNRYCKGAGCVVFLRITVLYSIISFSIMPAAILGAMDSFRPRTVRTVQYSSLTVRSLLE